MAIVFGLTENYLGVFYLRLRFQIQRCGYRSDLNPIQPVSKRIMNTRIQYSHAALGANYTRSSGRSRHQLNYEDHFPRQPFWLNLVKEALWALKSLFIFLVEQPSQLKYIEWPSFQSTLNTATLTLVLVALLIVALCSVDSALCYFLALLLRGTP